MAPGGLLTVWARRPSVLQLESAECGAAALKMILAYHGRIEPLSRLRDECGVSRDGSRASQLCKAARRLGIRARGLRKEVAELKQMRPPLVLYWNFNHFVVYEGYD